MALTDEIKTNDIIDINIDGIKKQKFRINGDPQSVIELNLSDLNISDRLEKGIEKLQEEMSKISGMDSEDENLSEMMKKADEVMCNWIDYIFDSPVSAVFSKAGSMYDPLDGMFRYERIIDGLTKLYTDNLNQEYKKLRTRVQKHTDKYTGKKTSKTKK